MKKLVAVLSLLLAVFILAGCANGSSDTIDNSVPAVFVTVEGGIVTGGSKYIYHGMNINNVPTDYHGIFIDGRTVTINTFYMSDHEVTQYEYQNVMGTNPSGGSTIPASGETQGKRPVEKVSWYDAIVYCNKKSLQDGLEPCYTINGNTNPSAWGAVPSTSDDTWNSVTFDITKNGYRLPTEAEWEYAARGGNACISASDPDDFSGTDDETALGTYAWYRSNSSSKSHEVKKKTPSSLGIYDMSGNVWEWCWDRYGEISTGSENNPTGATSGINRIARGGGWYDVVFPCSAGHRNGSSPSLRTPYVGFRVVRSSLN